MDKRTIVLITILFALIIIGMFTFTYLERTAVKNEVQTSEESTTTIPYPDIVRVDAKHFYQNGIHTLAGELLLPTPCDLLEATTTKISSDPEVIELTLSIINNAESCIEKITPARFLVSEEAGKEGTFRATFMGRPLELNLVPAANGETPDDFELYSKG